MQGDLFGSSQSLNATQPQKINFLQSHRVTLGLDQILAGVITLLVAFVLVFSFGVEKGKQFAFAEIKAERAKNAQIMEEFRTKIFNQTATEEASTPSAEPARNTVENIVAPVSSVATPKVEAHSEQRPQGKYTIQIVTFTSKQIAEKQIARYTEKGHRPFLIPSGKYLQLCVDGFDSRETAARTLGELKSEGAAPPDAYVRLIPQAA